MASRAVAVAIRDDCLIVARIFNYRANSPPTAFASQYVNRADELRATLCCLNVALKWAFGFNSGFLRLRHYFLLSDLTHRRLQIISQPRITLRCVSGHWFAHQVAFRLRHCPNRQIIGEKETLLVAAPARTHTPFGAFYTIRYAVSRRKGKLTVGILGFRERLQRQEKHAVLPFKRLRQPDNLPFRWKDSRLCVPTSRQGCP